MDRREFPDSAEKFLAVFDTPFGMFIAFRYSFEPDMVREIITLIKNSLGLKPRDLKNYQPSDDEIQTVFFNHVKNFWTEMVELGWNAPLLRVTKDSLEGGDKNAAFGNKLRKNANGPWNRG